MKEINRQSMILDKDEKESLDSALSEAKKILSELHTDATDEAIFEEIMNARIILREVCEQLSDRIWPRIFLQQDNGTMDINAVKAGYSSYCDKC